MAATGYECQFDQLRLSIGWLMFWLGLLVPTCYVSLVTGVSVPTQWPLLSIFLPALMWRRSQYSPTFLHYLGLGLVIYSVLGLLWAPHPYDTMYGIWSVVLWGLSFQFGFRTEDPTALYKGLALGLTVSSLMAIPQWFGYDIVATYGHNVAGLLFNRTVLGALSALVMLVLIQERLWWYIPALVPGFVLCGSRGGYLIFAIGLASRIHPILILVLLVAGAFFFSTDHSDSDHQRLLIWGLAMRGLTWLGYGAGSFEGIYYVNSHEAVHAEFVHNDYLQLPFEFGVMALVPFAILVSSLLYRPTPVVWALAALGTFYFPLYNPTTAFLGCFAVGHTLRGVSLRELGECLRRLDLLPGNNGPQPGVGGAWEANIPASPRPAN